jgi:hypothetical protein
MGSRSESRFSRTIFRLYTQLNNTNIINNKRTHEKADILSVAKFLDAIQHSPPLWFDIIAHPGHYEGLLFIYPKRVN